MHDVYDPACDTHLAMSGWSSQAVEHYFRAAIRAANRAPLALAEYVKFGRCQEKDVRGLRSRPMYRGVEQIITLTECPRLVARSVEEAVIQHFRSKPYWGEATVINRKNGGGPLGPARLHVVYLVITETFVPVGGNLLRRSEIEK